MLPNVRRPGAGASRRLCSIGTTVPTASTSGRAAVTHKGESTYSPNPLDPYMTNITVTTPVVTSAPPPTPTISVSITPPAGAVYTYSHTQGATTSGTTTSTIFTGIAPTGFAKTGVWNVSWTLF